MAKVSWKEKFYDTYGKHVRLIEITIIVLFTLSFLLIVYYPIGAPYTLQAWTIGVSVITPAHAIIFFKIAKIESYPYEILWLDKFRSTLSRATISIFFIWITCQYIIFTFFPAIYQSLDFINKLMGFVLFTVVALLPMIFFLSIASITDLKKARLSIKTVLHGLQLINKEEDKLKKAEIFGKHISWFRSGLKSFNSFVFHGKYAHIEIMSIDEYANNVGCAALIGNQTEKDTITEQVQSAFNSIPEKDKPGDLRNFLIALKNIKTGKNQKDYEAHELSEMVRVVSRYDKAREHLTSPYLVAFLSIIAILLQIIPILWKT